MDSQKLIKKYFAYETTQDKIKLLIKFFGVYVFGKIVSYIRWRSKINKSLPGPPDNLIWGVFPQLYEAGLGDFWGFNPTLFKNLHSRYGSMVRFWFPGSGLFVSCSDLAHIDELNRKCRLRPDLTEVLLPYLGSDNLLFQKGDTIKQLRMRYGGMVNPPEVLTSVNDVACELLDDRAKSWSSEPSVNLHQKLDAIIYDIMGQVIFGGYWSDDQTGQAIRKEHLYLIHWASRYGMKVLETPSFSNLMCAGSDCHAFFASIKRLRALVGGMIEKRRKEIASNPEKFKDDKGALTNLVTNPVSPQDKTPFFSQHLATTSCIGLLNGAYDTTHATTFWCFYHLARYPDFQTELAGEIKRLFGKEKPTLDKLRSCELLTAFIQESMRLYPTVPIGMRVPEEDVTIGGIHVPKGTTVMPFLDDQKNQTKYFGANPEEFRPHRFVGQTDEAKLARKSFDRFGNHSRMCVGMTFALAELNALVARTVQNYVLSLADPTMPKPAAIYEAGVYQPKEKFHLVFTIRT